jgi:TATA-binding protein-associated factor Taf7
MYQRNLEKLRRKKLGKNARNSSEESFNHYEENDDDVKPFEGARPDDSGNSEDSATNEDSSQGEDDTWMVDDTNEEPTLDLPAAFSMNSHQDLTHQFKIVCQLLTHLAVTPPEDRQTFMENSIKGIIRRGYCA